jgi:hypothetical protein
MNAAMTSTINITLTPDEAEIIIDALEADMEGYLESAKESRGNARRSEAATFAEAAERIGQVLARIRAAAG